MHPRVEAKEGNTESIGGGYNNNNNNGQVGIDKRRPRKSFLTDRGGGSKYRKEKLGSSTGFLLLLFFKFESDGAKQRYANERTFRSNAAQ